MRRKIFKNFSKRMETVFFQGLRFLGGLKRIQKAENRLKINLAMEDLQLSKNDENIVKIWNCVRSDHWLTVIVHRILINDLEKSVPKWFRKFYRKIKRTTKPILSTYLYCSYVNIYSSYYTFRWYSYNKLTHSYYYIKYIYNL